MTRISKKILSCILGAIACFAVLFGVLFTSPETKTADAADTAITFSAAVLGDASDATYGTSIRFNTSGAQWATYHNWVSAADWATIADYTTVNGRTVTEINNANPGKQPITLMMQPSGGFSFLRLYLPADIMSIDDVRSMGILDGWSFNNGTNNYTASETTFLRNGDSMVLASNYTSSTIVTPTIGTAVSGYRTRDSVGGDSWVVSIDLGSGAVYGEYDLMYDGYKYLRNAIYINGKSIEEWNTQAIEENSALGDPSSYMVFPQNSTDPTHLAPFVKPVGLWGNGTDDVAKLTILKSLVADVEEIVVTVGTGAHVAGSFMVAENVSKIVHTQTTKDITSQIQCMTNTIDETKKYAVYYIFADQASPLWTASARHGGCLGEEVTGTGGQSVLKYVYFNGKSVWDINTADNGAYDSTHGNIINGKVYAPIFADVSAEVGGSLKLTIPLNFAGLDENGAGISDTTSALVDKHQEIVLKRGLTIYDPTTGISSYLTNDIVFSNTTGGVANNTRWTKEVKANEMTTEVTGIVTKANRTDNGSNENFVIFQLSNNDYAGVSQVAITDITSLAGSIVIDGSVYDLEAYQNSGREKFFNVWGVANSVAFRFTDVASLQNVKYITIKAGAKFPSYNVQYNNAPMAYYVTTEDVTFVHDVPNDTWTVGEVPAEPEEVTIDTAVTGIVTKANRTDGGSNESFLIFQLSENDYEGLNTKEMADISSLADSIEINGLPYGLASYGGEKFFNVWGIADSIAFRFGRTTAEDYLEVQEITHITIKAGAKFPAYTTQNGGTETYYVTTEDVTFVHALPQDAWVVGDYVESEKMDTAVTGITNLRGRLTIQLETHDYTGNNAAPLASSYSLLPYYISYVDAGGVSHNVGTITNAAIHTTSFPNAFAITIDNMNQATLGTLKSVTIKAGARFPTLKCTQDENVHAYYVTTEDVTYYQHSTDVWSTEVPTETVDITDNIILGDQGSEGVEGSNTYIIKLNGVYWTTITNLNKTENNDVGGSEVLKYIKFNGTSIYDINANDDETYGSQNSNVLNGGVYAPIYVSMGVDTNATVPYSYIQLRVPTGYPDENASINANHQSIEILSGFSITENGTTWTVTENLKWINLNGNWVNAENTFAADTVEFSNPRREGDANELYKVDITSTSWNNTADGYLMMYPSQVSHRSLNNIFINGVSVYDINTNTDYSSYVFSTSPQTGHAQSEAYFARPVLVYVQGNKMTLWIHEDYINSLGGKITVTLGAGYSAYTEGYNQESGTDGKALAEDVDYDLTVTVTLDGVDYTAFKGVDSLTTLGMATLEKPSSATMAYKFNGWYIKDTETVWDVNTKFTEAVSLVPQYEEIPLNFIETQVVGIAHDLKVGTDTWLKFDLSNHDYPAVSETVLPGRYEELLRIGFLDHVVLKGTIVLNSNTVEEATLMDVYNAYDAQEGPYLSTNSYDLIIRVPVGSGVNEIIIKENCYFPSYAYLTDDTGEMVDTRYVVLREARYVYNEANGVFAKASAEEVDIQMVDGASVRIKDIADDFSTDNVDQEAYYYKKSGLRFVTNISEASLETLKAALGSGKYTNVTFGTLIVTTGDLMGGQFTHDWLNKNGVTYLDIDCTAGFYQENGVWQYAFPENENGYYSFFGSVVKLKDTNYDRWFSGLGYIKLWHSEDENDVSYIYAPYSSANSRSMAYVANAAIADRSTTEMDEYVYEIGINSYSPYTKAQNLFLSVYGAVMNLGNNIDTKLDALANKGGSETVNLGTKLEGPYVTLTYSTNVNVWGEFTYTDGSKTANEDFYLMAGTTQHKQYLDIYRYNGVAYGMNASNITMQSITFTNAELQQTVTGNVKILGFGSENKSIDTSKQEIYLTVPQDNGSEMTVGAHLGLGGALTYLAKSGLYEGVNGSYVKVQQNTSGYSDYYGHATSSKPGDGAVNLINNNDAGRQIQQSWYAQVGGSDSATNGENGYTRAKCYTESSAGKYWPYNPVQAGDVMSNPSQIIDYEIKEPYVDSQGNYISGYIYVKTRAMDWGKGQMEETKIGDWVISSKPAKNAIEGGVTTKSYMENYYRLNKDGTLYVNNSFVDWNGFTNMDTCAWASTELPAVYPIQSLNYYVSNLDGNGTWTDTLEYDGSLSSWVGGGLRQFRLPNPNDNYHDYTMVEDWFAWANGNSGSSIALGMYIPNVDRFTSGRSTTSNAKSASGNNDANSNKLKTKGLMSNMQPISKSYQGAYVGNTSYTAPGIDFRMEAYKPIEYTYVIAVDTVNNVRSMFKAIKDSGKVTNAGDGYQKVGLDAWARADKAWTQY